MKKGWISKVCRDKEEKYNKKKLKCKLKKELLKELKEEILENKDEEAPNIPLQVNVDKEPKYCNKYSKCKRKDKTSYDGPLEINIYLNVTQEQNPEQISLGHIEQSAIGIKDSNAVEKPVNSSIAQEKSYASDNPTESSVAQKGNASKNPKYSDVEQSK
ncbi:hypothetical protein GLW05_03155 [Pontibacillus yanchengensis]|uniref:Uncharacterized protein n=1 Tax=Pontibacillus yanchengensis TaxID=462910 RepID=A0A6I4ZQT5_9BACI|nr:hypothetical protein [Pontibacillus yanchengensis]MYL32588.1 hypothetical protein [Pontibacillus yanchengensis]